MIELNHLDQVMMFDQEFVLLIEVIHRMGLFLLINMLDQHLMNYIYQFSFSFAFKCLPACNFVFESNKNTGRS
jgi:hypothetical protein